MEHEGEGDTSDWSAYNNLQRPAKETGRLGNKRINGDYPDCSIINIGQNNNKSPGDLRRFAVNQTPVRNHRLTFM